MKQLSTINENLSRIPQYQSISTNSVGGSQNIEPRNSSLSPKNALLNLDTIFKRDPSYEERKSDLGLNQSGVLNPLTLSTNNLPGQGSAPTPQFEMTQNVNNYGA